ncbi:MAG TPA: trimethylamine methyltransferase family protein [Thermoleophilia bacterium]|nr:trimethylamine methyltransferase family protein [Thermoleophilia bacterium]
MSAAEKDALHQRVLHVLEHVGIGVGSTVALDLLADAGACVDRERRAATLPPELVESCLQKAPASVRLAARDPAHDLLVGVGSPLACCTDGMATMVFDDVTTKVRDATRDDLVYYYGLYDALEELDFIWTSLTLGDRDPLRVGLETDLIALESTSKHLQSVVAHSPEQVPPLLEMLEAIAGAPLAERPIYSSLHCPVSPLRFEGEKLDASIELARHGVPILIHPLPLLGTTAPMSVLGTTVITLAEILAAVTIFQLAAPGCALMVVAIGGCAHLRTGGFLCGTPEVALVDMAGLAMTRQYGLPSMSGGMLSDAHAADFQAGSEGALLAATSVLCGADLLTGAGLVNSDMAVSTAKAVLDCDTIGSVKRLLEMPDAVDDASTLIEDIAAVGPGGQFLARRSSRENSRRGEIWCPSVFQRDGLSAHAGRSLVSDALERAAALLAAHAPTPIPDDACRQARAAFERYVRSAGSR